MAGVEVDRQPLVKRCTVCSQSNILSIQATWAWVSRQHVDAGKMVAGRQHAIKRAMQMQGRRVEPACDLSRWLVGWLSGRLARCVLLVCFHCTGGVFLRTHTPSSSQPVSQSASLLLIPTKQNAAHTVPRWYAIGT